MSLPLEGEIYVDEGAIDALSKKSNLFAVGIKEFTVSNS